MSGEIATLVEDTLTCLATEHPTSYSTFRSQLGDRSLELSIDDECFFLDIGSIPLRSPTLSVTTSIDTLCDLVHGDITLLDALLGERVDIVGNPADLVALSAAMTSFMQGAMRCVSMPALLDRLVALRKERT